MSYGATIRGHASVDREKVRAAWTAFVVALDEIHRDAGEEDDLAEGVIAGSDYGGSEDVSQAHPWAYSMADVREAQ